MNNLLEKFKLKKNSYHKKSNNLGCFSSLRNGPVLCHNFRTKISYCAQLVAGYMKI